MMPVSWPLLTRLGGNRTRQANSRLLGGLERGFRVLFSAIFNGLSSIYLQSFTIRHLLFAVQLSISFAFRARIRLGS
jgi:hypothetical protein